MNIQCPQCGVIGEGGANHPHESNCPIRCSAKGCKLIAVREVYMVRKMDLVCITLPLCRSCLYTYAKRFGNNQFVLDI